MRPFALLALLALLMLSACASPTGPIRGPVVVRVSPSASLNPSASPVTSCAAKSGGHLTSVKVTDVKYDTATVSDSITFSFAKGQGEGTPFVPTWELKQADPPFSEDGSGNPVTINGTHFFALVFQGTDAHEFEGETARKSYPGPKELLLAGDPVVELEETGDFEAVVSFVIGLDRLQCPDIEEKQNPLRLVLNFSHPYRNGSS